MRRAFDFYADAGDWNRAVAVAVYPIPSVWEQTDVPELLSSAITMVPPDSVDAGRLLSTSGWFSGLHEANYESAHKAFERSLEIAQRHDDAALERQTLVNAAQVDYFYLKWQACREKSLRAIELAVSAGDQRAELLGREWLARVALVRGELDEARIHSGTAVELAEKLRERSWLATTHIKRDTVHARRRLAGGPRF